MSFPEESRHTPATAHSVEPAMKAASTLSLRAPFSGGVQIAGTTVLRKRARETAKLTLAVHGQRRKRCSVVSGHFLHTGHNGSARFDITNNCPYTVWASAVPGGGIQLNRSQTWPLDVKADTKGGRVWARTNCNFDGAGRGSCQTGDCGGVLQCQAYGETPNTVAEFALNQNMNMDFIDMTLMYGFNIPMEISSTSGECNWVIKCTADIMGQCPAALKVTGGCNGPCPIFKTDEYCCNSGSCGPTNYSSYFKDRCPDAYTYRGDTSLFTCPVGTNYRVVFCP